MQSIIRSELQKLSTLLMQIQQNEPLLSVVEKMAERCTSALKHGKKILFAGNGGSAADAQHLAAELVVRIQHNRPGLAAIALTTDASILTAVSNDYGYDHIFSRQVEALGNAGDVFIGISTSGKSANILRALEAARAKGLETLGFCGANAVPFLERCDEVLEIPSLETPKIQECHIVFGHILCSLIEMHLFGDAFSPLPAKLVPSVD